MKRREFITLLGGAAVAWPIAARGQQKPMSVGYLHIGSPGPFTSLVVDFVGGLRDFGYIEGQNLTLDYGWAEGRYDRLPALAADMVRRPVDIIVAIGSGAALAAVQASRSVPLVFMIADDPVGLGLATSFNRPGGNATGISVLTFSIATKRLQFLLELVPHVGPIGVLLNPSSALAKTELQAAQTVGQTLGREVNPIYVSNEQEIDEAFVKLIGQKAAALFVTTDPLFTNRRAQLVGLADRYALPATYSFQEFVNAGGLTSYGPHLPGVYRQMGIYAARILKGEKPSDLPIEQPTKFVLALNLKTARALKLEVPPAILATADEVIE